MLWKRGWGIGLGLGLLWCLTVPAGSALAPEPAESPAATQDLRLKNTVAPGGAYTLGVPIQWELTWTKAPNGRGPSELKLTAPGEPWPEYVTITVLHFAEAHRTPERYLFDLLHAQSDRKDDARTTLKDVVAGGRPAKFLEAAANRYPPLGMAGDKVPSIIRHVIVPASQGFFVLRYDVPERLDPVHREMFDRAVESFAPGDRNIPVAQDQIPAGEYDVYAALFGVRPPSGLDAPQFFDGVLECRQVAGSTMTRDKPLDPGWPGKDFGVLDPGLVKDYLAKNWKVWQLTDRIMVPDLAVIPAEELEARLSAGFRNPAGREEGADLLREGVITLTRVGFNGTGDLALLGAALTYPGTMRARYIVLMKKREAAWDLVKVAMEGLMYQ